MSGPQFPPLGPSGNVFIDSDPPGNVLVQWDIKSTPKRPRSISSPLRGSAIISFANENLAVIDSAVLPTFSINATDPAPASKTIKAQRRHSEKTKTPTDKKIINLKKDVTAEADKKHKLTPSPNLHLKKDEIKLERRRDSQVGNDSHSPRVDIYGEAKALFTQLKALVPGSYLLLKLGKKIEDYLPLICDKIDPTKEVSMDLANEMKLFIHNVQINSTYKQYKKAIKIVETGLQEEALEDLFGKLKCSCEAYEYEVYTHIILQRAITELQLNSTSPRNLKRTAFLTHLCEKLDSLKQDYFHKFPTGFQELFKNFHREAKAQLKVNTPKKHEQSLKISDQRTPKIEAHSTMNSSTAAITYMLSICECEAMHVLKGKTNDLLNELEHMGEVKKVLNDLRRDAVSGNFLRLKIGKEIEENRNIFKKWMSEPFRPLPFTDLKSMEIFYDSISKNEAYGTYLMLSSKKQKLAERTTEELKTKLIKYRELIKRAKKASKLCDKFNSNDISKKADILCQFLKYQGKLEIAMETFLEKALDECDKLSKVKLPETDIFSNFISKTKYKIDNFSKHLKTFPEGYLNLFKRLKKAIVRLELSQQTQKLLNATDIPDFSAINQLFTIFEEDIVQLHQKDTMWVLKNLDRLQNIHNGLQMRKFEEERHLAEQKSSPEKAVESLIEPPNPENDEKLLVLINKKLEKAKKFPRLKQLRRDILNIVKDSQWTQNYLFKSDDINLLNLQECVLNPDKTPTQEMLAIGRSRTKKRLHSRGEHPSIEKSSSSRVEKSRSPSRSKLTLTRSTSSASIEDTVIFKSRIKTSNSPDRRPLASLSESTSDSQSPRVIERSLPRARSCKLTSSSPRKISSSPRIEDQKRIQEEVDKKIQEETDKKIQEEINKEFITLLIAPGVDNNLQRHLLASYATFFKPIKNTPPLPALPIKDTPSLPVKNDSSVLPVKDTTSLVELLKALHKKFLEEGPFEKKAVMSALVELLWNSGISFTHYEVMEPLIRAIITDAHSTSDLLQPYIESVEKLIPTLVYRSKCGPPQFHSLKDYTEKYEITSILSNPVIKTEHKKESKKIVSDPSYEKHLKLFSESLKRINLYDYIQIDSSELKDSKFSVSDQCPHISNLGNRFWQLSDWVLESIFLKREKTDGAAISRMIEFFIDVIDKLLDNYSKNVLDDTLRKAVTPDYLSAVAIYAALQKPFVEELFIRPLKKKKFEINIRHTSENSIKPLNISEDHLKKYLSFKEILALTNNIGEIRKKIKKDQHCIPPIFLMTKDITNALEAEPTIINNRINLRCVDNFGSLLYTMATRQKHLISIYSPFGKKFSLYENEIINFDQLFQIMTSNKKYHKLDGYGYDSDLLDTLCRNKVQEIFSCHTQKETPPKIEETKIQTQGNVSPRKEEAKIQTKGNVSPRKEEQKVRFET